MSGGVILQNWLTLSHVYVLETWQENHFGSSFSRSQVSWEVEAGKVVASWGKITSAEVEREKVRKKLHPSEMTLRPLLCLHSLSPFKTPEQISPFCALGRVGMESMWRVI